MEISEDLRCVFSAEVEEQDGSYVVEVPKQEVRLETLRPEHVYRVAILGRREGGDVGAPTDDDVDGATSDAGTDEGDGSAAPSTDRTNHTDVDASPRATSSEYSGEPSDTTDEADGTGEPEPPVDRGDEVTVDIEGIGDQGDGIARVDRGYVIIVPDTEKGERVRIRVTSVKQNVAFAEVVERVERHHYE
ncbi:TRAM domain-containing protein [Halobaculum roseum]|uniref:TRAM domain-containing protein n=1 Tax=Halobaculum roseum TaxID=2175149 RepID=A0ABD5MVS2_9EURY|nr:TRAM domain-containing protein [Halobaculum roseum]QZY04517.1 TRAM domain-containing protein [Halobaculum roseum]